MRGAKRLFTCVQLLGLFANSRVQGKRTEQNNSGSDVSEKIQSQARGHEKPLMGH
jgi:hypothetical protein